MRDMILEQKGSRLLTQLALDIRHIEGMLRLSVSYRSHNCCRVSRENRLKCRACAAIYNP